VVTDHEQRYAGLEVTLNGLEAGGGGGGGGGGPPPPPPPLPAPARGGGAGARPAPPPRASSHRIADPAFKALTIFGASTIAVLMAAITVVLIVESRQSIGVFGAHFLWSDAWRFARPGSPAQFGALTFIYGTVVSSAVAMVIAVPLALVIALLLVELVHPVVGRIVGTAIEMLAAVPSIIFGMWGIWVLVPIMQRHVQPAFQHSFLGRLPLFQGPPMGIGLLTAGIILSVMVLPFITAVTRDVLKMVPPVVKEAGFGMGATTWEVTHKIGIRYALQGIVGAIFIGLGRALGETMAVSFVLGGGLVFSKSLVTPGNTIPSLLATTFAEANEPLQRSALIELGLVLFAITLLFQLAAHVWLRRVRRNLGGGR
jgi:phosphate transport system permease protein